MRQTKVLLSLSISMMACCSGMQWTKVSSVCRQAGPVFSNLVRARAACSELGPKCHGVYDVYCDGRRTFLWQAASFIKSGAAGCVHKLKETFQPTSGAELKKAARTAWGDSPSVGSTKEPDSPSVGSTEEPDSPSVGSTEEPYWLGDLSSYKFEKWDPHLPRVSFGDLHGSVIYAVRRMGWPLWRNSALAIAHAAMGEKVRLVAIAKERHGSEVFTRTYWPAPAEIYYDSKAQGYPFFAATNGQKQGLAKMAVSFMFGGEVAKNWRNAGGNILALSDTKGSAPLMLGSLIVVSRTGEVLFHHKEKVIGDQPDPEKLKAAIKQLGETGVAACECKGES